MKRLPSEIGREISLSSEGNLKEIEEDSLRALRGMQGELKGIHFTIYRRLKRCLFEIYSEIKLNIGIFQMKYSIVLVF